MEYHAELCDKIVNIIHERSESGHLVRADEILTELKRQVPLGSESMDHKTDLENILKEMLQEDRDLAEIVGGNGVSHYYSVRSMSETYARILVRKSEDPLRLIAEVVRDNSRLYPRPFPVTGFIEPPFDLTQESILQCLEAMSEDDEYQDIAQTTTSVGKTFLYSRRHLDPDYAATLAEWSDVGQAHSP